MRFSNSPFDADLALADEFAAFRARALICLSKPAIQDGTFTHGKVLCDHQTILQVGRSAAFNRANMRPPAILCGMYGASKNMRLRFSYQGASRWAPILAHDRGSEMRNA